MLFRAMGQELTAAEISEAVPQLRPFRDSLSVQTIHTWTRADRLVARRRNRRGWPLYSVREVVDLALATPTRNRWPRHAEEATAVALSTPRVTKYVGTRRDTCPETAKRPPLSSRGGRFCRYRPLPCSARTLSASMDAGGYLEGLGSGPRPANRQMTPISCSLISRATRPPEPNTMLVSNLSTL